MDIKSTLKSLVTVSLFLISSALPVHAQKEINQVQAVKYFSPTWSADGKQIAATAYDGVHYNILVTEVENPRFTRLFPDDTSNNRVPKWSPNGRFIVYNSDRAGKWDLWVKETNGPNMVNLTADLQAQVFEYYDWSPDGQWIAFVAHAGLDSELWISRPDGTNKKNLAQDFPYSCQQFGWDTYSQSIAFAAFDLNAMQRKGIWRVSINETTPVPLTLDQSDFEVAWSSNGHLAVARASGINFDIWRLDADGSDAMNLTPNNPEEDENPTWTRDGQSLLFVSEHAKRWGIWSMSADGSNLIYVSYRMAGDCIAPVLSPDGRQIVFQFYPSAQPPQSKSAEIWISNLDGSNPVNLTPSADQIAFVPQINS